MIADTKAMLDLAKIHERESCALLVEQFAAEVRCGAIAGNRDPVEAEAIDERLTELAVRMRQMPDSLRPAALCAHAQQGEG